MKRGPYQPKTDEEVTQRLLCRVEKTATCWLWRGAVKSGGYGHFKLRGKWWRVHRWFYQRFNGPLPPYVPVGECQVVDHECNNCLCVNPDHLRLLTVVNNVKRRWK